MSPWNSYKARVPVVRAASPARLASRAVEGRALKLICLVACSRKRGLSGSKAYGCPLEQPQKRGLSGSGLPLPRDSLLEQCQGCVLKLIRLVAWSQNEVYPVRRLTEQPQSEVCPVLGRL